MDFVGRECTPHEEAQFLKWLADNGACLEGIGWPEPLEKSRGAVALDDIPTDKIMFSIPEKVMITTPRCKACPELAIIYEKHETFFAVDEDRVLVLFIMHEMLKGKESFWHPYFSILPQPESIIRWSDAELMELQNGRLVSDARRRPLRMRSAYNALVKFFDGVDGVCSSDYTFELYQFAWMTIQARAFGRRLPYTAIVPFADCLNHANVQVKYDFNVVPGVFRMFPSGSNSYAKGAEVFNSYGRRTNKFLLMEYGFAILDNEWAGACVGVGFDPSDGLYTERCALARSSGLPSYKLFRLSRKNLIRTFMPYFRLLTLNEDEIDRCFAENDTTIDFNNPISLDGEVRANRAALRHLKIALAKYPTSIKQDEEIMGSSLSKEKLKCAVRFRLTEKKILSTWIQYFEAVIEALQCVEKAAAETGPTLFAYLSNVGNHLAR